MANAHLRELTADGYVMPHEGVNVWREGSSYLPGAKHIVEMVERLAAEGDSLEQILPRIRGEADLIRRYENGPGPYSETSTEVAG